jgi:MFS superfamily sulfate permease-like transporter
MTYLSLQNYEGILYGSSDLNSTATTNAEAASQYLDADPAQAKVKLTMALSFGVGFLLFLSSIFHVGALTKYLSDPVVNAFTIGSAYHTVVSQLTGLLGISIPKITNRFFITEVSTKFLFFITLTTIY